MLVFIDESGDAGFKFDRGSSLYFTVVAVIFQNAGQAASCERAIIELRREHRLPPSFEFHFTNCSEKLRLAFFSKIACEEFQYHAVVLNKRGLHGSLSRDPEEFYRWSVTAVCSNYGSSLRNAKVVIDQCGDRRFAHRLGTALKSDVNVVDGERRVRKVVMQDSRKNDLVQLADVICGAIRCKYGAEQPKSSYWDLVRRRELRVQTWPEKQ